MTPLLVNLVLSVAAAAVYYFQLARISPVSSRQATAETFARSGLLASRRANRREHFRSL